jgi:hypothetical protein
VRHFGSLHYGILCYCVSISRFGGIRIKKLKPPQKRKDNKMEQDKIILLAKICQLKDMQIFLLKEEETLKNELEKLELAKNKEVGITYHQKG